MDDILLFLQLINITYVIVIVLNSEFDTRCTYLIKRHIALLLSSHFHQNLLVMYLATRTARDIYMGKFDSNQFVKSIDGSILYYKFNK